MFLPSSDNYNYHSHTEFCDGRASISEMAAAAADAGMSIWGVSPHSPICVDSPCNMKRECMPDYFKRVDAARDRHADSMTVLRGMEIDYISPDFGPHIDYFQNLPLDFRIGSVHFVPNQDGIRLDCDGRFERFSRYLKEGFHNDLRYVVEKFYEQELMMIERGGFDILGHFDKIAGNAALADPDIEHQGWYMALVEDVVNHSRDAGLIIEINTKSLSDKNRFFPSRPLWPVIEKSFNAPMANLLNSRVLVNSDAHYPDKVDAGRREALAIFRAEA